MEEDKKAANNTCSSNNNSPSDVKQNDDVASLDSLGVFLNRFRQMDTKKLQQLASNPTVVAQSNGPNEGTAKDTNNENTSIASTREKMLEVVYGNKLMGKEKQPKFMCFVVDAQERKIRIMSREEQKKQESSAIILEDLTDDQFARFGKSVKDKEADNSDAFVHCEKCSLFYEFCCLDHPLYQCKDRVPSSSPTEIDDRAASTLPAFLFIQNSSIPSAGKGVFTKVDIPIGIVFGPYEGILTQNVSEMEFGAYTWELRVGYGKPSYYIDAKDPRYSNWMRYINSPRNESEQNLIAFQYQGSVYYRVFKPIDRSSELLVWYGKKYGKELGIIDTSVKRVPRSFFYYTGKSPFIL
ncbi:hypothetical protein niasHS_006935 [Heterodera schachtii]|uniref:SET domain-containing protein n=1 Tax=Heterodera schachtii TaxID=97005 RepID=A0ABD2JG38_HETSC